MEKIRTRYAPSPTGKMHVGNLRSALYEFLVANMRAEPLCSELRTRIRRDSLKALLR